MTLPIGRTKWAMALATAAALAGCASRDSGGASPAPQQPERGPYESRAGIDEPGGIQLFGGGGNRQQRGPAQIGVNSFLWRATLDTLNFMPLASADPFGGVIITEWFTDQRTPNERFKATVYILDTRLRADGIKVALFKQVNQNGSWVDAATDPDTGAQIENAILTRARELRLASVQ